MSTAEAEELERVRALAQSLDCLTEPDLCLLGGITLGTAETWRKRGRGPSYVLFGNRYFYPRQAVAEYVASQVRSRDLASAREAL